MASTAFFSFCIPRKATERKKEKTTIDGVSEIKCQDLNLYFGLRQITARKSVFYSISSTVNKITQSLLSISKIMGSILGPNVKVFSW